jgi:AcrR family transcriptional regulator
LSAATAPDARERILDAAEDASSQEGFAAARVAAIAASAGVDEAALERTFGRVEERIRGALSARVMSLAEGRARGTLNPDLDPRFAPVVPIAPSLSVAAARPLLGGLLGADGDAARATFAQAALAILMDGPRIRHDDSRPDGESL